MKVVSTCIRGSRLVILIIRLPPSGSGIVPELIQALITNNHPKSKESLSHIRRYNSSLAFFRWKLSWAVQFLQEQVHTSSRFTDKFTTTLLPWDQVAMRPLPNTLSCTFSILHKLTKIEWISLQIKCVTENQCRKLTLSFARSTPTPTSIKHARDIWSLYWIYQGMSPLKEGKCFI